MTTAHFPAPGDGVEEARQRLVLPFWTMDDQTSATDGGLGDDGHDKLPLVLQDIGVVAQQVGIDAAAVAADKTAVAADKDDIDDMVAAATAANAAAISTVNSARDTAVSAAATATDAAASVSMPVMSGGDVGKVPTWSGTAYVKDGPYQPAASALTQGRRTIWLPALAMTPRDTAGAAPAAAETATNKVMRQSLDFDAATQEYAQFMIAMPKSWNEGSISYQALWTCDSGAGGVVWALQAVAVGDGDAIDAAFGAAQTVTDTLVSVGALHQTAESASVVVAGSPAENDLVLFQLSRVVANAADTLASDASLLGLRLFYTISAGNDA